MYIFQNCSKVSHNNTYKTLTNKPYDFTYDGTAISFCHLKYPKKIIIINFNIHPKPYRYSYPTADYRLLNNLLRNRLAARRDYILFSSLPSCYIPLQVVPFPSSQSVLTLSQQRSRGVQYREGTVDTAKRWTWSLLRFHGASSGNTSHGRQP